MSSLSKVLSYCPIQRHEWQKFIFTSLLMMLTIYVYSILRNTKDVLIISLVSAELVSTIKLYGVLPSAVLAMLIYTKLVDIAHKLTIYHAINIFFISFFVLFALYLYPNAYQLHPDMSNLMERLPHFKYFFMMINYWTYALFFILSELWGSVMLALLFWQFANQTTEIKEAKRFYPLFGLFAQAGLILAGYSVTWFSSIQISHDWQSTLNKITASIVVSGILLSFCLWHLSEHILPKDLIDAPATTKKNKVKMSLMSSLQLIFSSKYIGLIAILILSYGISINLVEGVWKKMLSIHFAGDANAYGAFNGKVQIYTGIATSISMLCSSYLLRILSWRTAAVFTPIIILFTGIGFFLFVIFKSGLEGYAVALGTTSVVLAVYFGAIQNVLSKAIKYSFFDPTKEIAYIPINDDLKAKGKSAADVVGGRLGKSGGAFVQWALLSFFPGTTLLSIAPTLFATFMVILVIWFFAVIGLSKQFEKQIHVEQ
ncbi:MAG: Npt1/Npt2 family nucleotide transporter [Candidatus Lariskella arthropodorum]